MSSQYKNLSWLWGADWKFRHSGNCSASRGSTGDAEQLPEWRNFQFAPKKHYGFFFLHTLPSPIAFRLEYVLFYQIYANITIFSIKKSSVRLLSYRLTLNRLAETDVKWRQKWHQNVKTVILTSCTRVVLHRSCKTTIPSSDWVHGNPGRVCKNNNSSLRVKILKFGPP